jgi:hypothetical protein
MGVLMEYAEQGTRRHALEANPEMTDKQKNGDGTPKLADFGLTSEAMDMGMAKTPICHIMEAEARPFS